MSHRWLASVLGLVFFIGGCAEDEPEWPIGRGARFYGTFGMTTLDGVHGQHGFIVYPPYLPESVRVSQIVAQPTSALLTFTRLEDGLFGMKREFWFHLEERVADGSVELNGDTPIQIGDGEGLVARSVRPVDLAWLDLTWEACGVEFRMSGPPGLLDDEAPRIAASTFEACD